MRILIHGESGGYLLRDSCNNLTGRAEAREHRRTNGFVVERGGFPEAAGIIEANFRRKNGSLD